jgi:hypothetical protein
MHADNMLLKVIPTWPNLFLVLAARRSALEAGSDVVYTNPMPGFLVPLQVVDCAEAINAGAALEVTFVGLIVFQHMLPNTFQPCIL